MSRWTLLDHVGPYWMVMQDGRALRQELYACHGYTQDNYICLYFQRQKPISSFANASGDLLGLIGWRSVVIRRSWLCRTLAGLVGPHWVRNQDGQPLHQRCCIITEHNGSGQALSGQVVGWTDIKPAMSGLHVSCWTLLDHVGPYWMVMQDGRALRQE